jgi:predicted O-methyltransferase YrrM
MGGEKYSKFINWIDKYLNFENIFKLYSLPIIWIDFEIKEENKPIRMENLYLENEKCINISKYNTVANNFYYKLFDKYFNISMSEYFINYLNKLLFTNFTNVLFISKNIIYKNNFYINDNLEIVNYINDNLEIVNYKNNFNKIYDLIIIGNNLDVFDSETACKTFLTLKKNVFSIIWSLKHLEKNGCIRLVIKEALSPCSNDLLLLLQQFCSVNIYYDHTYSDGTWFVLSIICTAFRDIEILIKHLEKILTFNITKNTGFFKIKKIIRGDIDKFNKTTLKTSVFEYNRKLEYIECFKNENKEFETMPLEIEQFIIGKAMFLVSKSYIPKPEHLPYISSLLHLKKMKVGDKYIDVHSNIKKEEGKVLYTLIKETKATQVLEIGMAYGLSSLFILQSLKYFHHKYNIEDISYRLTSIDPFQTTQWQGLGIQNLKNAKLFANHKLIEEKSYIALPKLINKKKIYDIVFIDGWHTFDYTLYDLFGAYLLVKINGYIVIDDALHPGVNKVVKYIETNYKFLKKVDMGVKTVAIYLKTGEDKREWNFHKEF